MKGESLLWAAKVIVARNLNEKVIAATIGWNEEASNLMLTYYVDGAASEDEQELCELALTELLAEFSDVKLANSKCLDAHGVFGELGGLKGLVYLR